MTTTTKSQVIATSWFMLLMTIIVAIAIMTSSCKTNYTEKVVIIDSNHVNDTIIKYKVNRFNEGVVEWIEIIGQDEYEKGDTIYWQFANNY
jgi:hypothetical protein